MASTTSWPSNNSPFLATSCKRKQAAPLFPRLLLLLLLLLLALCLLLNGLVFTHPHQDVPPHILLRFLYSCLGFSANNLNQGAILFHQLHYLISCFLLSPCSIFILANLIIFTLLFKTFYLSSSSSCSATLPDLASHKFQYGVVASHPEYQVPTHEEYSFLSLPPHPLSISSPDLVEDYKVLSWEQRENFTHTFHSCYNRDKGEWEPIKGVSMLPSTNGSFNVQVNGCQVTQKEANYKRQSKVGVIDKAQANEAVLHAPSLCDKTRMSGADQEKAALQCAGLQIATGKGEGKPGRSNTGKMAPVANTGSAAGCQAVVIDMMEPFMQTSSSAAPGRLPALAQLPPLQQPKTKEALPTPANTTSGASMYSFQRPPLSPKPLKKSSLPAIELKAPTCTSNAADGRPNAGGGTTPLMPDKVEKPAGGAKPHQRKSNANPVKRQSTMVRSYSDQRLCQHVNESFSEHIKPTNSSTGITSSSTSSRPGTTPRSHSARSSRSAATDSIDNLLTISCNSSTAIRPLHVMQRSQSLRSSGTPAPFGTDQRHNQLEAKAPASLNHVTRPPSFCEALDALSDTDANERFSSFIAHRFALMKKELG